LFSFFVKLKVVGLDFGLRSKEKVRREKKEGCGPGPGPTPK